MKLNNRKIHVIFCKMQMLVFYEDNGNKIWCQSSHKMVDDDLNRHWILLNFSPNIEKIFAVSILESRIDPICWTQIVGLFVFNFFLIPDIIIVPDILRRMILLQMDIITPAGLIAIWLIHRRLIRLEHAIMPIYVLVISAALYCAIQSHEHDAVYLVFIVPLILIFSNLIATMAFPYAALITVFAVLADTGIILIHPSLDFGGRFAAVFITIGLSLATCFATFRIETAERRAFLLMLRETLRSEILSEGNKILRDLSDTDALTGIGNRRFFDAALERMWLEQTVAGKPLSLLMIDIDHFKALNDRYGHLIGDLCLRRVAVQISHQTRQDNEVLTRYGGEEFALLIRDADIVQTAHVAERIRKAVAAMSVTLEESGNVVIHMTVSVGYAQVMPEIGGKPSDLIAEADAALYAAKGMGRNRIHPKPPSVAMTG